MALKITRRNTTVSVTDGHDIRMHGCKSIEAAIMLEAQLKADFVAALRWMAQKQSGQVDLPLFGGKFSRTDDRPEVK